MNSWVLVTDSDKNIFSLHGPMPDATYWMDKTVAAQTAGRQVHCSTIPGSEDRIGIVERALARGLTKGHVSPE
jgi:hypothetical protein